ncbi:membrane protein [Klebsiella pneumoniae]|nr:membrane protein [Klebsiella pneumoniae]
MSSAETTNPNAPVSMIEKWDKTFAESSKVDHRKVTFLNRYGITLVGDLYLPKDRGERKLAAIAVSGPFGAVKEQSSGLYAQTLAEQGFVTLAFDPSYTGESGGYPRNVAHRISIPRISVPRWTFWACKKRWIATVSVCSAFAAGAVWP